MSEIKNAVVARFQVQPVSFCLEILLVNITRLPEMGIFCEEFQYYRWQSIPTKFQVQLQVQHAWIQNKKVGTWMPSSRLPSQLSKNLQARITKTKRVPVSLIIASNLQKWNLGLWGLWPVGFIVELFSLN